MTTGKRSEGTAQLPVPNVPLSHWSSQLIDLRAQWSTDVPVLLLSQHSREKARARVCFLFFFFFRKMAGSETNFSDMLRTVHVIRST